jgi:hypothetical protein
MVANETATAEKKRGRNRQKCDKANMQIKKGGAARMRVSENNMVSFHQCKSEAELELTLRFIKDTCHAGAPNTTSKVGWGKGSGDGNAPLGRK